MMAKTCIDCETGIDRRSTRCQSCANRRQWQTSPHFPIKNAYIVFKGRRYYRDKQGWRASRNFGHERLHRAMWADANGPVPPKCAVIYKDGDAANNQLSNFELKRPSEGVGASGRA